MIRIERPRRINRYTKLFWTRRDYDLEGRALAERRRREWERKAEVVV